MAGRKLILTLTDEDGVLLDRRELNWDDWREVQKIPASAVALIWSLNAGDPTEGS